MWNEQQQQARHAAADALDDAAAKALEFVSANINWKLSEADVAQFIQGRLALRRIETHAPWVAFNANSANPNYTPEPGAAATIRRRGWLAIHLAGWIKPQEGHPPAVARASRIAVLGSDAAPEQEALFSDLRAACGAALAELRRGARQASAVQRAVAAAPGGSRVTLSHELADAAEPTPGSIAAMELHPSIHTPEFGARMAATACIAPDGQVELHPAPQDALALLQT